MNRKCLLAYNNALLSNFLLQEHLLISLPKFNLPLCRYLCLTHAAQALQSHDLSGEGIDSGSHTYFFDHMEGLPRCGISSMLGPPPRKHEHERQGTRIAHPFIPTRRIWKDDYDCQIIFGDLAGIKLPDISPKKIPQPGNLSRLGIEPRPTAWQECMLLPAPQWWTTIGNSWEAQKTWRSMSLQNSSVQMV